MLEAVSSGKKLPCVLRNRHGWQVSVTLHPNGINVTHPVLVQEECALGSYMLPSSLGQPTWTAYDWQSVKSIPFGYAILGSVPTPTKGVVLLAAQSVPIREIVGYWGVHYWEAVPRDPNVPIRYDPTRPVCVTNGSNGWRPLPPGALIDETFGPALDWGLDSGGFFIYDNVTPPLV